MMKMTATMSYMKLLIKKYFHFIFSLFIKYLLNLCYHNFKNLLKISISKFKEQATIFINTDAHDMLY